MKGDTRTTVEETRQPENQTADKEITSKKEDKLGRASFAEHLAEFIAGWGRNYSLVIALHGPWGSGKSSVKNMVVKDLCTREGDRNPVIEFNPWRWSGQDQITTAFFQEVGFALGQSDVTGANAKELENKWNRVGSRLTLVSTLGQAVKVGGLLFGGADLGLLSLFGGGVEQAAKVAGEQATQAAKTLGERAEHPPTLEALKKDLAEALKKLPKPIVIVMDDIDRLTPEELKQLFGLVKANADFPNLVFLLLFQRETVAESLAKALNIPSGDQYLKKIIQLEFNIPQVDQTQLDEMLYAGIRAAFLPNPCIFLDDVRWLRLYGRALQDYFQTLRDVYRFNTTLAFYVGLLSTNSILEVNPIDLIALQVLRVFEPAVYQAVANSKAVLTIDDDDLQHLEDETENPGAVKAVFKQLNAIIATPVTPGMLPLPDPLPYAETRRRERLDLILRALFPAPFTVPEEERYGFPEKNWEQERLACVPNIFDIYFSLNTPRGEVSRAQIQDLIISAQHRDEFVRKLTALSEAELLFPALRGLAAYQDQIELTQAVPFLTALCDLSDTFATMQKGKSGTRAFTLLENISHAFLNRTKVAQSRFEILEETLKATTGVALPTTFTRYEEGVKELDKTQIDTLKSLVAANITARVRDHKLTPRTIINNYLWRWLKWGQLEKNGNDTDAEKWIREQLADDSHLRAFVRIFNNPEKEYFSSLDLSLQPILMEITDRLRDLDKQEMTQDEREGVKKLRQEYRDMEAYISHNENSVPPDSDVPEDEQ